MYYKILFRDICGWLLLNNIKPGIHLFAGHEQLVPPKDCSNTSICWEFALHKGFTEAVHKELQLASAVPLIRLHVHLCLQSFVTKVFPVLYVLLPFLHCACAIMRIRKRSK